MKAAIFYATREGQTRKIAKYIAHALDSYGIEATLCDVRALHTPIAWGEYSMAWVAASVHAGRHEREMVRFARRYRSELQGIGAVFVSVTLSEAGAEDMVAPARRREASARDAQRMIDAFVKTTGWKPAWSFPVAGALAYSQYNWLVRRVMVWIARQHGASTDTSVDHEFTDWRRLDRYVGDVVAVTRASRA
jgi:menaquinone-dependent protoporphyrinogen oxidase